MHPPRIYIVVQRRGRRLEPLPAMRGKFEFAVRIVQELRAAGHEAYLVGGCVRDLVLQREPADYDIATDAVPAEVLRMFPHSFGVGAQFGVVLVMDGEPGGGAPEGNACVEVATFRSDIGYSDGRHPDHVQYTRSAQEDVQRRDFTINGLLYDPVADRVLDYVGGLADIRRGVVQTIGDPEQRFREDKLRMLRAVRFAARFGYTIEPATFAAMQRLAALIHQVSCERIREELTKMLIEGRAHRAFELLDESGLLQR